MYNLIGLNENIKNIYCLSAPYSSKVIETIEDLKIPYINFLSSHQPEVPQPILDNLFVIDDLELEEKLTESFRGDSFLNDKNQATMIGETAEIERKKSQIKNVKKAMDKFGILCKEHWALLNLVINHVIFRESKQASGGSSSSGIGVLWLNLRDHVTVDDIIELLIHESTHNLLFIDEIRYLHYNYELVLSEDNYAISSILKSKRPLDKVVHSIVVAVELILARRNFLGKSNITIHPKSPELEIDTINSINSVLALPRYSDLVTSRVDSLILEAKNKILEGSKIQIY